MALTHATKMALVPQELLERLNQQNLEPSPATKATNVLDTEMKDILDRRDISEDEKVKLYNQILSRYLTFDNQRKQPLEMKLTEPTLEQTFKPEHDPSDKKTTTSGQSQVIEDDVIDSVPRTLRKKAERLLKHLKFDQDVVDWNQKGEVLVDGTVIQGSHLVDLINDALRKRKNFNPKGWEKFNKALAVLNTPKDLIGNVDRWNYQHKEYQHKGEDPSSSHTFAMDSTSINSSPGLFAEAQHLRHSSSKKQKKSRKREKYVRKSYDMYGEEEDEVPLVSSTTSPYRWDPY